MKEKAAAAGGKKSTKSIISWLKVIIGGLLLAVILDVFGTKGLMGFFVIVITMAIWRIIKHWDQFKTTIGYMETLVWGKPLERTYWKKGEFKKTKRKRVKFVWKKKDATKK